jgi:hypothetical protein
MKKVDTSENEMAALYYNLYIGCLKYKMEKTTKKNQINCQQYYQDYEQFQKGQVKIE